MESQEKTIEKESAKGMPDFGAWSLRNFTEWVESVKLLVLPKETEGSDVEPIDPALESRLNTLERTVEEASAATKDDQDDLLKKAKGEAEQLYDALHSGSEWSF